MRRPRCMSPSRRRSGEFRAPIVALGCRRCGRSDRGRGTLRPGAARTRRPNRRDRCTAGVLERDLLRAQVLLDRERVIRAAFHRRIVRDDHAAHAAERCRCRTRRPPPVAARRKRRARPSGRSRAMATRSRAASRFARARAACRARGDARGLSPSRLARSPRAARRKSDASARFGAALRLKSSAAGSTLLRNAAIAAPPRWRRTAPADQHAANLVRAGADLVELGVAPEPARGILGRVAVAAERLDRLSATQVAASDDFKIAAAAS